MERVPYYKDDAYDADSIVGTCIPTKYHDVKVYFLDGKVHAVAVCPVEGGCVEITDPTYKPVEECWVQTWVDEDLVFAVGIEIVLGMEWETDIDYIQGWPVSIKEVIKP